MVMPPPPQNGFLGKYYLFRKNIRLLISDKTGFFFVVRRSLQKNSGPPPNSLSKSLWEKSLLKNNLAESSFRNIALQTHFLRQVFSAVFNVEFCSQGMRHLRMHMLAAQGYCVVQIDSRGSQHRGLRFESHLRGKMVSKPYPQEK